MTCESSIEQFMPCSVLIHFDNRAEILSLSHAALLPAMSSGVGQASHIMQPHSEVSLRRLNLSAIRDFILQGHIGNYSAYDTLKCEITSLMVKSLKWHTTLL